MNRQVRIAQTLGLTPEEHAYAAIKRWPLQSARQYLGEIVRPEELPGRMKDALERNLDVRTITVMREYYWNGLMLTQIGEKIGVSNSRVAQIIRNALVKLRRVEESSQCLSLPEELREYSPQAIQWLRENVEDFDVRTDDCMGELPPMAYDTELIGWPPEAKLKPWHKVIALGLSNRITNFLLRSNIKTIWQLHNKSINDLLRIYGLGWDSVSQILEKLAENGLAKSRE